MLHTKYQGVSRLSGFRQEDFQIKFSSRKSIFSLSDLDMQQTGTI